MKITKYSLVFALLGTLATGLALNANAGAPPERLFLQQISEDSAVVKWRGGDGDTVCYDRKFKSLKKAVNKSGKSKKSKKSKKSEKSKKGKPSDPPWDTFDTGGCSCEQIIEEKHRDHDHKPGHLLEKIKYGCSEGEMKKWVKDLGKP